VRIRHRGVPVPATVRRASPAEPDRGGRWLVETDDPVWAAAPGQAAVLYDGPSAKARKLSVLSQGYPVEILVTLDAWLKVRDASGELAWIEAKNLSARRMVMVKVPKAEVRQSPDEGAPVLFQAEQDVLLEVVETADNWARVKHRDGETGYIRITQVWGL
jgi:SH3-like domain-containing protein